MGTDSYGGRERGKRSGGCGEWEEEDQTNMGSGVGGNRKEKRTGYCREGVTVQDKHGKMRKNLRGVGKNRNNL